MGDLGFLALIGGVFGFLALLAMNASRSRGRAEAVADAQAEAAQVREQAHAEIQAVDRRSDDAVADGLREWTRP